MRPYPFSLTQKPDPVFQQRSRKNALELQDMNSQVTGVFSLENFGTLNLCEPIIIVHQSLNNEHEYEHIADGERIIHKTTRPDKLKV